MREVVDDGFDFGRLQGPALDLGANGIEAFRGSCGTYRDQAAAGSAKRRNAGSDRPISSGPTKASSSVISSVASRTFECQPAVRPG